MNINVELSTLTIEVETSPIKYEVEVIQNTVETNTVPITIEAEILGYANAGQSAYEIWLGEGNIGTEQDFLNSLKGVSESYIHNQIVSSSIWNITHNLDKYPSITIVDSGDNVVVGEIQYLNSNQVLVTFSSPFSGKAYIN